MESNLISGLAWVSKGYAMKCPREYDLDEEEIEQMKNDPIASKNLKRDLGKIQEQEEFESEEDVPNFCQDVEQMKNDQGNDEYPFGFDEMSEEDKEDFMIKATDALIVAAKIEKEFSSLEIYVYEEDKANLYVHHEIQLSAFPLAIEWLNIQPTAIEADTTKKGNFAIVASFLPEIEIWNLDIVNVIEPAVVLGGEIETTRKKVKQFKSKKKFKPESHTDSVIALALNKFKQYKNILCSGSADMTVKLWDILQQKNVYTYKHHSDKIQVTKWNPKEESVLLSGGQDYKLCLFDVRSPNTIVHQYQHKLAGDIEGVCWDPIIPHNIIYCTEQGHVVQIDARNIEKQPIAKFKPSNKSTTSVAMNYEVPGMLATTCLDGKVRIYDVHATGQNGGMEMIAQTCPKMEKLYCGQFYEDSVWNYACGSSIGELFVWDTAESKKIVEHFGSRMPKSGRPKIQECSDPNAKQIERVKSDDDDDDDDEKQINEMDEEIV